jgi:ATP/ADP translocase
MSLEVGCLIAVVLSLGCTVPLLILGYVHQWSHRILYSASFLLGYFLLFTIFLVDALVVTQLSPFWRFSRGFTAGLAVGLLLSGTTISCYDAARRRHLPPGAAPDNEPLDTSS